MSRTIFSIIRNTFSSAGNTVMKSAVAATFFAVVATGAAAPAIAMPDFLAIPDFLAMPDFAGGHGAPVPLDDPDPGPDSDLPTGPLDPKCAEMPTFAACQGGPYWQGAPTSPSDPQCATMPVSAACAGGPYAPPQPGAPGMPMGPGAPGMPMSPGMPGMPGHM